MLSVIVPVYNVEKFLARCLDSIIHQTYKDLEILIVNDASPDASQKIIDQYARKDPRIKVFIHEKNKGLGGARNTGLDQAKGKYIAFVDSDDFLDLSAYEKLIPILEKEDLDILSFGYWEYSPGRKKIKKGSSFYFSTQDREKMLEFHFKKNIFPVIWNKIYKKSLFEKDPKFRFLENTYYEDMPAKLHLFGQAQKIRQIKTPFYYYFFNQDSIIQQKFTPKHLTDYLKIKKELNEIILEKFLLKTQENNVKKTQILDLEAIFNRIFERTVEKERIHYIQIFLESFPELAPEVIDNILLQKKNQEKILNYDSFFSKIGIFYLRFLFFLQKNGIQKTIIKIINTIFRK